VLNPTSGVTAKQPYGGLSYENDPSRPGGGVFVLHGENRDEEIKDLVPGVVITSPEERSEGETSPQSPLANERAMPSSPFAPPPSGDENSPGARPKQPPLGASTRIGSSMVNLTPLRGGPVSNVNPAMNTVSGPENVKVMNVLDVSQTSTNTLEQLSNADIGFLEGIPGGMFDWGGFIFFLYFLSSS